MTTPDELMSELAGLETRLLPEMRRVGRLRRDFGAVMPDMLAEAVRRFTVAALALQIESMRLRKGVTSCK